MTKIKLWIVLLSIILGWTVCSAAQEDKKNEFAGIVGKTFVRNQVVNFGNGLSGEVNYTRRLKTHDLLALSLEVPAVANFDEDLHLSVNIIPEGYRSLFVTPSARINFFPRTGVSPWFSGGGGFGYFRESGKLEFGGTNTGKKGTMGGVMQFGGGFDVRITRSLRFRTELRDFYSLMVPQLNVSTGRTRQHNLFVGGGIVWSF